MLVEREHFERLGGFDPWIFLYHEDNDLCYRTWLLGRRVLKAWMRSPITTSGAPGAAMDGAASRSRTASTST